MWEWGRSLWNFGGTKLLERSLNRDNMHGHKRTTYERISLNEKIRCATLSEIGFKTTSHPYEIGSVTITLRFKSSRYLSLCPILWNC
ncbi:unnamed protein product [Linum trigynum]|uniref:Uncharacterized protein n=1 Tax=Linum trigynum TaxID=586398 RepID=A0AAV2D398_9ROSI